MTILQLEHAISDYQLWKAAFDRDPVKRQHSGVRGHHVLRPVDDPNYVVVDLEFDDAEQARAFRHKLDGLWRSRDAAPALAGRPRVRILDTAERREYEARR